MNKKDINILVIPDVHGRSFWKDAVYEVLSNSDAQVIFLGDYLDPYRFEEEFADFGESEMDIFAIDKSKELQKRLMDNFKEIIEVKKNNPDRVILLLGNHDLHYTSIDKCGRYDYLNSGENHNIFNDNRELFQMAYEKEINGRRFIFSHAGISTNWLEECKIILRGWTEENIVDWVNNAYITHNGNFFSALNNVSNYRGGLDWYGSMVWADFREYLKGDNGLIGDYQIMGHTQLNKEPFIWDDFADLDCRRSFYINNQGDIVDYLTDETMIKTENKNGED